MQHYVHRRVQSRELVTRVGALGWCGRVDPVLVVESLGCDANSPVPSWVAEPRDLGEDSGLLAPRVEGTAPGWFHRAASTSRSRQWKDHEMVQPMAHL